MRNRSERVYTSYPNQRCIQVNREDINGSQLYTRQLLFSLEQARKDLSPNGFKLWTYFAQNQDAYQMMLSSQDVMEKCRFSGNTYTRTFKELVDTGYLVQFGNNDYDFFELPRKVEPKTQVTIHRAEIDAALDDLEAYISG